MTTWKIIQIYKVPAASKQKALERFHRENPETFFASEFAVEDKSDSFFKQMLKQILG